jgi:RNA-directed DNA polymerase
MEMIRQKIERRLEQCKLKLNPEKTRIVYCKDSKRAESWHCYSFDFLGYTFRPRSARNYRGEFFVSFSPAISQKSARRLRQTIRREWKLAERTHLSLSDLVRRINPVVFADQLFTPF